MKETSKEDIKEIENSFKEANLMSEDDSLLATDKGDYWEKFLIFNSQVRGYYYYTKKKLIFIGGALGSTQLVVPYESIKSIKKCNVALFIPTGIKLEVYDEEKGKLKKYKLSVLKRDKWIKFIEDKIK